MTMTIRRLRVLAALDPRRLAMIVHRLQPECQLGRPWSQSLRRRVPVTCGALRTNLTFRELAAVCGTSKSTADRIVAALVPRFAALAGSARHGRRWSWAVDGTLIPTRDHACAAKSKNYLSGPESIRALREARAHAAVVGAILRRISRRPSCARSVSTCSCLRRTGSRTGGP